MPDNPNNLSQFWQELKRRRVVHTIVVYSSAAFVIIELINNVTQPLSLPDWTPTLVIIILLVGFPLAIIFSWIFDVTPDGIEKTSPIHKVTDQTRTKVPNSWKIATYVSVIIIIGLIAFNIFGVNKEARIDESLEKSIAVLPFQNLSMDSDQEPMCLGLTDEIINYLFKIESFTKISSFTSVLNYRTPERNMPAIAEELGVNYLLEGTYKKIGEELRVSAQLIEGKSDRHIWQQDFNRPYKEIISIQSDIALQIADHLNAFITNSERSAIMKSQTEILEAYNLYLRGRFFWHRRTKEDLYTSIDYFTQAIELDTIYAYAYAGLADAYHILAWWDWYPVNDGYSKGKKYALKALSIDNNIAEAHATLGAIAFWHEWNWDNAEKELMQAISLNSNYATAHQWYAGLLHILRRHNEAREQINLSLKLNPNSFIMYWLSSVCYYHNADYKMAIEESKKALEIENENGTQLRILKSYVRLGENEKAIEHIKEIIAVYDSKKIHERLDEIYQKSGIEGIIYWLIDWILVNEPAGNFSLSSPNYTIAALYSMIGDTQKACDFLEKSNDSDEASMPQINSNPDFEILRSNPRFIRLLEEMQLL